MKQNCKWIAALFTAASTTLAFGCCGSCGGGGCGFTSYNTYRLAPVGERVIYTQSCPSCVYSQPSAGQVIGNVVSAPFRMVGSAFTWTGQTISGQPTLQPVGERVIVRRTYLQPVGERVIIRRACLAPVGERIITTSCTSCMPRYTTLHVMRQPAILQPVGERFVTTRVIRYQRVLQPVGERFTTVKIIRHHKMLAPVGERCTKVTTTKLIKHHGKKVMLKKVSYRCGMLKPVGEKTIIRTHKVFLKPVGERVWTYRSSSCGCR